MIFTRFLSSVNICYSLCWTNLKFQPYLLRPQNYFFLSLEVTVDIFDNLVTFLVTILSLAVHITSSLGTKSLLTKFKIQVTFSFSSAIRSRWKKCSALVPNNIQPECSKNAKKKTPPLFFLHEKTFFNFSPDQISNIKEVFLFIKTNAERPAHCF